MRVAHGHHCTLAFLHSLARYLSLYPYFDIVLLELADKGARVQECTQYAATPCPALLLPPDVPAQSHAGTDPVASGSRLYART